MTRSNYAEGVSPSSPRLAKPTLGFHGIAGDECLIENPDVVPPVCRTHGAGGGRNALGVEG
jgi:hypothetical protein